MLWTTWIPIIVNLAQNDLRGGLPWWSSGWESTLQCRRLRLNPWVGKISWRREQLSTPMFWPGEFHGQRNLAGYSPWDCKESDMTEQFSLHYLQQSQTEATQRSFNRWKDKQIVFQKYKCTLSNKLNELLTHNNIVESTFLFLYIKLKIRQN